MATVWESAVQVPIADVPQGLLHEGIARLRKANHLCGAVVDGPEPAAFVQLAESCSKPSGHIRPFVVPYHWDTDFGGVTSLTFFTGTVPATLLLSREQVAAFEAGRLLVVFCSGERPYACRRLDFAADSYAGEVLKKALEKTAAHRGVLPHEEASLWAALGLLGLRTLDNRLTPEDRLSLGWASRFQRQLAALEMVVDQLGAAPPFPEAAGCERFGALFRDVRPLSVEALFVAFRSLAREYQSHYEFLHSLGPVHELCDRIGSHAYCGAARRYPEALVLSSEEIRAGRRLPSIRRSDGKLEYLPIQPADFPEPCDPKDYWPRIAEVPVFNGSALIGPKDFPADLTTAESWRALPKADDVPLASAAAMSLLEEAVAKKRWTIPDHAIVEVPFGPFASIELVEAGDPTEVFGMLKTKAGEFALVDVEPGNGFFHFEPRGLVGSADADEESHLAALKLVCAAVIRDFFVVEERASVFASRRGPRIGAKPNSGETETRVVYLPRVRYVAAPNLERCASELEHSERRAHFVAAHLRRAGTASPHQLALASRYGLAVPTGYTFVRPHERGGAEKSIVYRSRSALRSLFQVADDIRDDAADRWFQFEKDVQSVMASLGFVVEHVSKGRRGDGGVDVFARKGTDLDEVSWVVQCKCYSPTRVIGPSVVRELVGTLQEYPRGTRGMIATTSSFSAEACRIARTHEVRLMDGDEFFQLACGRARAV